MNILKSSEKESPKVVPNLFYAPGKQLIQVYAVCKNDSKPIATIWSLMDGVGKRLHTEVNAVRATDLAILCGYFEIIKPDVTKNDVQKRLDSCPAVISSKVHESSEGMLIDSIQFPIRLSSGNRAFFVAQDVFNGMLDGVRERFGSLGESLVYEQGYVYGKKDSEILVSILGRERLFATIKELVMLYSSVGLGRPELLESDPVRKRARIRLYDSLECQAHKTNAPFSRFIKGHVTGFAEAMYDCTMVCNETKCAAMGDGYCEFEMTRKI